MCELLFIPIFMGVHALIVFSYYYLPGPISSVPLNVMNLLQLVLFFGTGLITYKLFMFGAPTEEIILDGFMRAYIDLKDILNHQETQLGELERHLRML